MTDPIADMLTRIRNAKAARLGFVAMPYSKIKEAIAKILRDNGYIADFSISDDRRILELSITGSEVSVLDRLSKPGRRLYVKSDEIPSVLGGRGMVIVSTSSGMMTGREAKKLGLGGELICRIW